MALRMITDGNSALHQYHSLQSVGIVKATKREPVTFTLQGERVVDYVKVDIDGLVHLDGSGWNFFFVESSASYVREAMNVSGFYDARLRKGHINLPQDQNIMVDLTKARVHRLILLGCPADQVAAFITGQCTRYKFSKRIGAQIGHDLGLPDMLRKLADERRNLEQTRAERQKTPDPSSII